MAAELSIPVVDTWTLLWNGAGHEMEGLVKYLHDGLHLTAEAYEVSFSCPMSAYIESMLQGSI
jgi:hypothetical protein